MRAASVKHVECECDGGVRAPEELDGPALFGRFHVCRCDACQKYSDDEAACRALGYRGDVWVDGVGASVPIEFLLAEVEQARKILPKLSAFVGKEIPWIEHDQTVCNGVFVGDAVEWDYDGSGEWVLVNYNKSQWVTMSYVEAHNVPKYRREVGLE